EELGERARCAARLDAGVLADQERILAEHDHRVARRPGRDALPDLDHGSHLGRLPVHRRRALELHDALLAAEVAVRQGARDDADDAAARQGAARRQPFEPRAPRRRSTHRHSFSKSRSQTPCPRLRPRRSNLVSGRHGGRGAKPSAVLRSPGVPASTASTCSAYSCQSVATCNLPPGASRETASAANDGCTSRLLWWRFFGQGSGKNTWIAASEPSGTMPRRTSTASCCTMRRFVSPSSSTRRSRLPTPGACTSTAM